MAFYFVGRGFHVGTGLCALLAFAALRRGRFGWGWAFAVAVVALGMLGDLQIVAYAVVPILLAGFVAMLRQRTWRSGAPEVAAAFASVVVAEILRRVADALGAFKSAPLLPVAHLPQMFTNLVHVATYGAALVGLTDGLSGTGGIPILLWSVHVVGALIVAASLLAALTSLVAGAIRGPRPGAVAAGESEPWRLDDLLLIAALCSTVPFVVLALAPGLGVRYLVVAVVFASVLTGRRIARVWPRVWTRPAARGLAIIGMAVCLSLAAGLGFWLSRPGPTNPAPALASWLEAHHLRNGIGDYWAASITTIESSEAVTVRPVLAEADGDIRRMDLSPASWYGDRRFQFLVYGTPEFDNVDLVSATRTWGAPAHIYVVGSYRVLVWAHPLSVAPSLSA